MIRQVAGEEIECDVMELNLQTYKWSDNNLY